MLRIEVASISKVQAPWYVGPVSFSYLVHAYRAPADEEGETLKEGEGKRKKKEKKRRKKKKKERKILTLSLPGFGSWSRTKGCHWSRVSGWKWTKAER